MTLTRCQCEQALFLSLSVVQRAALFRSVSPNNTVIHPRVPPGEAAPPAPNPSDPSLGRNHRLHSLRMQPHLNRFATRARSERYNGW